MLFDLNSLLTRLTAGNCELAGGDRQDQRLDREQNLAHGVSTSRRMGQQRRGSAENNGQDRAEALGWSAVASPSLRSPSPVTAGDQPSGIGIGAATVRPMVREDISEVIDLHLRLFDDTFAQLGRRFLRHFYHLHLDEIALVAIVEGRVAGYHLTSTRGRPSLLTLMRLGGLPLVVSTLRTTALAKAAWRHLSAPRRRTSRGRRASAFSLYTAVAPEAQRRGIAKLLLREMVVQAALRGIRAIEGEHEDDPNLHSLYQSAGFHILWWETAGDPGRRIPTLMIVDEALRSMSRRTS